MSVPETLPKISKIKKTTDKIFSYGSFNNYQKLSDDTIKVWSEILKNSNSKIYLKNSILDFSENIKNNIINKFCKNGANRNQIIILERTKSIIEHYESYKKIDVALDTFPYPGVTTSFESILMGVPVLTMKGFNLNSRCGESIIRNLNLTELIADNETDYVEKAIALQDEKNLIKISGLNLRDKALSSPLFDTDSFTKDFEKIMLNLV
jgi:predicted O-linked N-acetylglucosamine transferase (SPINDLY family)